MAKWDDPYGRLRRIDIPRPNPALQEWLSGPECRFEVERYTALIYNAYVNYLPAPGSVSPKGYVRKGKLRRGAYMRVALGTDWGRGGPRYFGYIGNRVAYARVIEYGSSRRGIAGRHDLERAANALRGAAASIVGGFAETRGSAPDLPSGLRLNSRGRVIDSRGRFARDPRKR